MKRRALIRMFLVAAPVAGAIIACNREQNPGSGTSSVLKIGSILTLTGPAALLGQEIQIGQKLAVDYWKEKGVTVEIVFEDSKNQPKEGLTAFQSLKARGIQLFTANGSGVALAIKPEIQPNESTLLALAAHPGITDPVQPGVFRYSNTATEEAKALFNWIQKSGSKDTVLIFHSADEYGLAFANALRERLKSVNLPFVVKPYRKEDVPEMRSLVQSAIPKGAYLPVVVGAGQPMAAVISVLRSIGYTGTILANIGYALTGVQQQLGSQAGKVVYLVVDMPRSPELEAAARQYKASFNKEITPDAAIGFNTVSLFVKAFQELKSAEPSKINAELTRIAAGYFGIQEPITNNEIVIGVKTNET